VGLGQWAYQIKNGCGGSEAKAGSLMATASSPVNPKERGTRQMVSGIAAPLGILLVRG